MSHTPGPWCKQSNLILAQGCDLVIAKVFPKFHHIHGAAQEDANARLICAAPDLLQTLISARKTLSLAKECIPQTKHQLLGEVFDQLICMQSAIAKATGGKS